MWEWLTGSPSTLYSWLVPSGPGIDSRSSPTLTKVDARMKCSMQWSVNGASKIYCMRSWPRLSEPCYRRCSINIVNYTVSWLFEFGSVFGCSNIYLHSVKVGCSWLQWVTGLSSNKQEVWLARLRLKGSSCLLGVWHGALSSEACPKTAQRLVLSHQTWMPSQLLWVRMTLILLGHIHLCTHTVHLELI